MKNKKLISWGNKLTTLAIVSLLVVLASVNVFANKTSPSIRVGLTTKNKNVTSIPIKNKSLVVGYENNGVFSGDTVLTAEQEFYVTPNYFYYVRILDNLGTYENARQVLETYKSKGETAAIAFIDSGNWGVYLGKYENKEEAEAAAKNKGGTLVSVGSQTIIKDNGKDVVIFENKNSFGQVKSTTNETVALADGLRYRGIIEFTRKNAEFIPVNVINLDEYLYSVVASEMPSTWHIEALKAQSVAARNYTFTQTGTHKEKPYQLCDSVHCQSYLGASNESEATRTAVTETIGLLAYHNDKPINAVYFSSSGGYTADSEKVWQENVPYLRGKKEIAEKEFRSWERKFTTTELTELMKTNNAEIGNVSGLSLLVSPESGRVLSITFLGENGSKTYSKDQVRTIFSKSKNGSLNSTYFNFQNPSDIEADGKITVRNSEIVLNGKGWGHGVGMSQYGAKGMAEEGNTYIDILKHYYTNVEVR